MPRRMSKSPLPPLFHRHRPPRPRLRRLQPRLRCRRRPHPRRAFSRTRHLSRRSSQPAARTRQMTPRPTPCRRRTRSPARFLCRGIVRACWRSPTPTYRCRGPVRVTRPSRRALRPTHRRPATIPASATRACIHKYEATAVLIRVERRPGSWPHVCRSALRSGFRCPETPKEFDTGLHANSSDLTFLPEKQKLLCTVQSAVTFTNSNSLMPGLRKDC